MPLNLTLRRRPALFAWRCRGPAVALIVCLAACSSPDETDDTSTDTGSIDVGSNDIAGSIDAAGSIDTVNPLDTAAITDSGAADVTPSDVGPAKPPRWANQCQTTADCASYEDGNACNGTLFCNKSQLPHRCALKPSTVVSCPAVNDHACATNQCDPTTGECAIEEHAERHPMRRRRSVHTRFSMRRQRHLHRQQGHDVQLQEELGLRRDRVRQPVFGLVVLRSFGVSVDVSCQPDNRGEVRRQEEPRLRDEPMRPEDRQMRHEADAEGHAMRRR